MSAPRALDYAQLVGRYVDMERPATKEERAAGHPPMVGLSGNVESVRDGVDEDGYRFVDVLVDYGMGYRITALNRDEWRFMIHAQDPAARVFDQ